MAISGRGAVIACSSNCTAPDVGWYSPAARRKAVVLPQPEAPTTQRNSPGFTARLRSSTIGLPPSTSVTFEKAICAISVRDAVTCFDATADKATITLPPDPDRHI